MKINYKIKKPIAQELKIFEKQFYKSISSKVKLLDLILIYILNRKGNPKKDTKNPNPKKQKENILGLEIIKNLEFSKKEESKDQYDIWK